MPRWASRLTLEITEVRVQRVQEISWQDAMDEGVDGVTVEGREYTVTTANDYQLGFRTLWDTLNATRPGCSWADNPWVWAITFSRVCGP
jgi:hypothetical protein